MKTSPSREFMICPVTGYMCPIPACDWKCERHEQIHNEEKKEKVIDV